MAKRNFLDKNEFFDMGENDMAFVWNSYVEVLLQMHPFFSKISIFSSKFSLYEYPKQVSTTSSKDSSVSMKGKYSDFSLTSMKTYK